MTNLIPKDLPIENAVPKITKLKKDLNRCTNHSQQLQELFVKHPNVHVRKIAPLDAAAEVVQPPSAGRSESAKGHLKISASANLMQTEIHRESAFNATTLGSLETLHRLFAQGVNPYVRNDEGDSLLHIALLKGHVELATFLIQVQGLPADLKGTNDLSVLEQAIQNDEPLVIAGLLHAIGQGQMQGGNSTPAILTKANTLGQTPLQQVVQHNAVRVLEDWTNNFGFKLDNLQIQNQPVLDYVAKNGSHEMLASVVPLLLHDAPSNATKAKVFALARECMEMGKPEAGRYLVKAFGVDLEKPGQYDRTLFQNAVIANNLQEMRMLKALGADIHATDEHSNNAFHLAACFANPQTLQVLNSEFGFKDLEVKGDCDRTAFLGAAATLNLANLRALQEMGANIHAKGIQGETALDLAKYFKAGPEVIQYLESLGVKSGR